MKELNSVQSVRLIDVFLLAPFMVYVANKSGSITRNEKLLLTVAGILTAVYNGRRYLDIKNNPVEATK